MNGSRLRDVFQLFNELVEERVIHSYALIGAFAAIFYVEAIRTFDLDFAVTLPAPGGRSTSF